MRIAAEPANSADGKALLAAMDIFAVATYPEFEIKNMWDAAHIDREAAAFLIARGDDGAPLACGALFLPEPGVARINRMYVSEQARGRGFGGALLTALEELAIARGAPHRAPRNRLPTDAGAHALS